MGAQVSAKDLSDHGLVLITPSEGAFSELLGSSGVGIDAIRQYSVLIRNKGSQSVIGFAMKWDLVQQDGRVETRNFSYTSAWNLIGHEVKAESGMVIGPGSTWLTVPGGQQN